MIGSMMCHDGSATATHQALVCMMPTSPSQPWPAASTSVTCQPSDSLPHFLLLSSHIGGVKQPHSHDVVQFDFSDMATKMNLGWAY